MAWERATIALGDEVVNGLIKRDHGRLDATVPWRAGLEVGGVTEIDGARYRVLTVRDPGGRHEVLELNLGPVRPRTRRPKNENDRLAAIRAVIAGLDLDDPAHVTADGRPDANALSERLGWRVSARERDQAWKEMTDHDR